MKIAIDLYRVRSDSGNGSISIQEVISFMTWDDFYDRFGEWSDSTLASRISSLKEMGPSSEIAEVAGCLNPQYAEKLIQKAVSLGKIFTPEDLMEINGVVQKATLDSLAELYMTTKKTMEPDDIIELSYMLSSKMIDKVVRYNADMGLEFTADLVIELEGNVSTDVLLYALNKRKTPLSSEDLEELEGVIDISQLSRKLRKHMKDRSEDEYDDEDDDSYDYGDTSGRKPGLLDKLGVFFLVSETDKYAKKRREKRQNERGSSFHVFGNSPAKYHIGEYGRVRSRRLSGTILERSNSGYSIKLDDGTFLTSVRESDIERSLF